MLEQTSDVLDEVLQERLSQEQKWGQQDHPNGPQIARAIVDNARELCELTFREGHGNWTVVLKEEFCEAIGECDDDVKLRAELIQVAAVAVAWVEAIDRRPLKMDYP